jgi:hypothetical protein
MAGTAAAEHHNMIMFWVKFRFRFDYDKRSV